MIDKHGLKMIGLKKASGETCNYGAFGQLYTQISYDIDTGEVIAVTLQKPNWKEYHDKSIITICFTTKHLTMQDIADMIQNKIIAKNNL